MRMLGRAPQGAPPPKNFVLGSLQHKKTTLKKDPSPGGLVSPLLSLGLDYFFENENLVSFAEKQVEGKSLKKTDSKYENLASIACLMEGLELVIMDELMDCFIEHKLSLFGKFLAFRPNIDQVRRWVDVVWKLKGSVTIIAMTNSLFLFRFVTDEDLIRVLIGGPCAFDNGSKKLLSLCNGYQGLTQQLT